MIYKRGEFDVSITEQEIQLSVTSNEIDWRTIGIRKRKGLECLCQYNPGQYMKPAIEPQESLQKIESVPSPGSCCGNYCFLKLSLSLGKRKRYALSYQQYTKARYFTLFFNQLIDSCQGETINITDVWVHLQAHLLKLKRSNQEILINYEDDKQIQESNFNLCAICNYIYSVLYTLYKQSVKLEIISI